MIFLSFLTYAIVVHSLGLFVLNLIGNSGDELYFQRLSLAGIIGMGLIYLIGVIGFIVGLKLQLSQYCVVWGSLFLLNLLTGKFKGILDDWKDKISFKSDFFKPKILWVVYLFIVIQVFYILFSSFWRPVAMNDDWAQWAGNAKYLFYYGYIDQTYFNEVNLSSYPVFIMINEALLCKINGSWSDFFCKSFLVLLFVDFLIYFYCYFREKAGPYIATLGPFIVVSLPVYVRLGLNGTAENPMSIYVALFAMRFLCYLETQKTVDIIILGLIGGILAVIKAESLFLIMGFSILILIFAFKEKKCNFKHIIIYAVVVLSFIGPWLALMKLGGGHSTRLNQFTLQWLFDFSSYVQIVRSFGQILMPSKALSFVGLYFFFSGLYWCVNKQRDKETQFLILLIGVSMCIYAVGCFSTGVVGAYTRLLTHNVGLFVLVIVFQIRSFLGAYELHSNSVINTNN